VAESRSHPSKDLEAYLETVPVKSRVQAGSSLKFCWVAEGKADIYPRFGPTMEWDTAAGDCVYRQSGRTTERPSRSMYNTPSLRHDRFVIGLSGGCRMTSAVVWFTGLSGSGKSHRGRMVAAELRRQGRPVEMLDGDAMRRVFPNTGFSKAERDAHIRRVGYLASRLEHHGVTVVASFVSPYRESRDFVRGLCRNFVEVYVSTPSRNASGAM
jgi:hypothetical protein